MTTYERILKDISEVLERENGNKAALMRLANVDPDTEKSKFYKCLSGASVPYADAFVRWLENMGFTIVKPGLDLPEYTLIPKIKAKAGAGSSLVTSDHVVDMNAFRNNFLRRVGIHAEHSVLLDVIGDSMEPLIREGDTILVDQSDNSPRDGNIYLVGLDDELLVKRLQKAPGGWKLCSENPRFSDIPVMGPDLELFRVYGRVRWFGRVI